MFNQLTTNAEALRLFFTEDVYFIKDKALNPEAAPAASKDLPGTTDQAVTKVTEMNPAAGVTEKQAERMWNFEYLGRNQKGILILVNDALNKVSSPQGTELLRKLVKAIKLTNNDFALVNYAGYQGAAFNVLRTFFKCELILSFGVEAAHLGLEPQPLHQLCHFDQVRIVFTRNLHDLDADIDSKKVLWTTLQMLNNG